MSKRNLERLIYVLIITLSLIALALVTLSQSISADTKPVYQGF